MGNIFKYNLSAQKQQFCHSISKFSHQSWYRSILPILKKQQFFQIDIPSYDHTLSELQSQNTYQKKLIQSSLNFQYSFYPITSQITNLISTILTTKNIFSQTTPNVTFPKQIINTPKQQYNMQIIEELPSYSNFVNFFKTEWKKKNSEINIIMEKFKLSIIQQNQRFQNKKTYGIDYSQRRQNFVQTTNSFIDFLCQVIKYRYNKNITNHHSKIYNKKNIRNLATSQLFNQKDFYTLLLEVYMSASKIDYHQFQNLQKSEIISNSQFSLNQKTMKLYGKNINIKSPYRVSTDILIQTTLKQQPIQKLFLLFLTILSIQQQINMFYLLKGFQIQRTQQITYQTLLDILKYLIVSSNRIKQIGIQIQIIKDFIQLDVFNSQRGCIIYAFLEVFKLKKN